MSKQANALGKILTAVRKEFGKSSAIRLSDGFRGEVVQSIPTGIEVFDNYVGNCGGLPVGRVVELFSEEGVGKSSLCLAMLAAAQRAGATTILSETENGFTEERATTFGVDPEQLGLFQPDYMEEALQQLELTLDTVKPKEGPYLIAWDSLAATPTKLEIDQGVMDKAAQDNRALLMSRSLRILTQKAARSCAVLLIVNQTRHKRGISFGDDTTTPGGNALKFHASIRLQLMGGKAVKKKDEHVGKDLLVFGKKNRFATPFRKARLRLMYDEGFDNDWSTLTLAKDWKLVPPKSRDAEAARARLKEIEWDRGKARDLAADLGFEDEGDE